jgi:hypothetical protein
MTESKVMDQLTKLSQSVAKLEERVEDLEDLRDLEQAIQENAGKPLIPWEQAKAELDLN